ncbi:Clavaminate synthase-like protein [Epithele typhae]|uniref:Clavaminate synthase-like protein n=1 Tax=Epithele typhae TaxID=378194 RepID=UPI00200806DA|nr:Clavaminate synthase-like protein [Epithele typhae]KAH9934538.1 Clavaminate synthase-like protein [Epithele typhae]
MPATTIPAVPRYIPASPTQEALQWADLPILDLSTASTPEGRAELAPVARDAMHTHGFVYIVNHGISQAQNDRIFDIADVPFSQVSEDEKKQLVGNIKETGLYRGYKLREYWHIDNGVRDQIEHFNMHRAIDDRQEYPKALLPLLPEIRAFCEHNHYKILHPILQLLARGMELPEDTFVDMHRFDAPGQTWARFMKYYPRCEDDEVKSKNVWLKGHTDYGSITILWSQPVTALQILSPDGKWRYVKHMDNALVVNVGDALEMLSGGFYKATIHRVVQPPVDQHGRERLGTFYFALTDDAVKLVPLVDSPVLRRPGVEVKRRCADADAPTMAAWRQARTRAYGQTVLTKREGGIEEEVLDGLVVRHYN